MKKNTKGFTLIELLAVIVILAIIMVIAVPQILNVIDNSRKSAWNSNVKMIETAMEDNEAIMGVNGTTTDGVKSIYADNDNAKAEARGCSETNIKKMADIGSDTTIAVDGTPSASSCNITLTGSDNFSGKTATISCSVSSGCTGNVTK